MKLQKHLCFGGPICTFVFKCANSNKGTFIICFIVGYKVVQSLHTTFVNKWSIYIGITSSTCRHCVISLCAVTHTPYLSCLFFLYHSYITYFLIRTILVYFTHNQQNIQSPLITITGACSRCDHCSTCLNTLPMILQPTDSAN